LQLYRFCEGQQRTDRDVFLTPLDPTIVPNVHVAQISETLLSKSETQTSAPQISRDAGERF
jgi:hypothetical protein